MVPQCSQLGRLSVVCAALFAQVVLPASASRACASDRCRESAASACCRDVPVDDRLGRHCPACGPRDCDDRPGGEPCRCRVRARQEAAAGAGSRPLPDLERWARFADVTFRPESADASAALLRLALLAGDAVPRRPPRILFGVWRH